MEKEERATPVMISLPLQPSSLRLWNEENTNKQTNTTPYRGLLLKRMLEQLSLCLSNHPTFANSPCASLGFPPLDTTVTMTALNVTTWPFTTYNGALYLKRNCYVFHDSFFFSILSL